MAKFGHAHTMLRLNGTALYEQLLDAAKLARLRGDLSADEVASYCLAMLLTEEGYELKLTPQQRRKYLVAV